MSGGFDLGYNDGYDITNSVLCNAWPTIDCCDTAPTADMQLVASEILHLLSGHQYPGVCSQTVRPCSGGSSVPYNWPYPTYPQLSNGTWFNNSCGCHVSYDCGCKGIPQVDLGRSDIRLISEVNIDGTTLPASSYRLDARRYLVRTDGSQWPCCQDLSKNIGEVGTWYVTLSYGVNPPTVGQLAAGKLACELQKACDDADDCKLPSRVTNVVRQGVSFTVLDPQDFLSEGRTGLYEVDLFLSSVNPNGLRRRATAWSPGMTGRVRVG